MKKFMKKILLSSAVVSLLFCFCSNEKSTTDFSLADKLAFIGIAVEEPGYHVWASSPIIGPQGKFHLFVARWPRQYNVDPGWRSHSEIAHYVSDNPSGPFEFVSVVLQGSGKDTWDKFGIHNPCIKKVGDLYLLFFIANDNHNQPPHPKNQRIGLVFSKSLYGPWEKAGENGKILSPSEDPQNWTYDSGNGFANPAFLIDPDDQFYLYFKAWVLNRDTNKREITMGVAVADQPTGPYIISDKRITANNKMIEDGYAFKYGKKFYLLTTDNHGIFIRGGGILWESENGIEFDNPTVGYGLIDKYLNYDKKNVRHYYGPAEIKFERPQVLVNESKPVYLYAPSGHNVFGGEATVSYV